MGFLRGGPFAPVNHKCIVLFRLPTTIRCPSIWRLFSGGHLFPGRQKAQGYSAASKLELKGELDGAGAADLVERIEAAVRAPGAQATR